MVESIGQAPSSTMTPLWVSVEDRESDVFDYIKRSQSLGWHGLVRICHNRVITTAEVTKNNRKTYAHSLESMTYKTIVLRGRNGEPQRTVRLEVAWAPVTIHPPENSPYSKEENISGWCIRCWEAGVDDGLEWILLTTVKVQDADDALQQIDWYSCRWIIE
ncbi:MAG: hypothetical protein GDA48_01195 [Hormoscilla sp. GM102CHS1]|nr:hypothetical protein [Hormoscilla sp. GM102CHS1]